ncbi:MAG: ABC transporter permease [Flavobacteriaceae bacterium]|nr:ABC transporter permease [Flavobacteriaceae bacterium]
MPEIESVLIRQPWGFKGLLQYKNQKHIQTIESVGDNFFEFFPYIFTYGNPKEALAHENNVVISEEIARLFFDSENPMGKTIKSDKQQNFVVSGVYTAKGLPSEVQPKMVKRIHDFSANDKKWGNYNYQIYYKLAKYMTKIDLCLYVLFLGCLASN